MPWLSKGCCCCSLKTGTIVISILNLVSGVLVAIIVFTLLTLDAFTSIMYGIGTLLIFNVIANILLLIGAIKGMKYLLLPWFIVSTLVFIGVLVVVILFLLVPRPEDMAEAQFKRAKIGIGIFFSLYIGLTAYYMVVVFSLFQELSGR